MKRIFIREDFDGDFSMKIEVENILCVIFIFLSISPILNSFQQHSRQK